VNIARLTEQKALHKLIYALYLVIKTHPDARLILIGDGHLRERITRLIEKLGLTKAVLITGFLENPFNITAHCRAFVLSSYYEGFGNVIIEAFAAGVPVISTDCQSGPREIIAPSPSAGADTPDGAELGEYGILTTPGDGVWHGGSKSEEDKNIDASVLDLAAAMTLIIEDEALCEKYRRQSKVRAEDFSPDKTFAPWLAILKGN
jgi:glycosyltransferase involved in cell wall biosynthesis